MGQGLYRRLIFKKIVEIAQLNVAALAATPGQMIPRRRELPPVNANDGSPRVEAREGKETFLRLVCQVETGERERAQAGPLGNVPTSRRTVVFSMDDLEQMNLIDPVSGLPLLRTTDRLHAIYDYKTEELLETIRNPPGLFAVHVEPVGYGFGGGRANLVPVSFEERGPAPRGAGT